MFFMLFDKGLLHADPHPGNYRFRNTPGDPAIVLYDFGCIRAITHEERIALLKLIHDTNNETDTDPYPLFLKLGFQTETLEPMRSKLPALCRVLFDPFSSPVKFDLKSWKRSERISDILGDGRWNFRISAPASLVFLMRTFHGITHYLSELKEPVSWTQTLQPLVTKYYDAMHNVELPVSTGTDSSFNSIAQHLCIKVTEKGTTKAKVTFKASAVDEIENLMDEDVSKKIEARSISLPQIKIQVRSSGYKPQQLFKLEEGDKQFTVWLE